MAGFLLWALLTDQVFGLVWVALAAASSIVALSYMAGEFLNMPSLKGFAKLELSELAVTVLIVLLAVGLATKGGAFDHVARGFVPLDSEGYAPVCPGTQADRNLAFAQAEYFLGCKPSLVLFPPGIEIQGVLMNKLKVAYESLMINEMFFGLLSGFSTNLEVAIPGMMMKVNVGMFPWIAMGPLNDMHTLLVDAVGVAFAGVATQKMLLIFIEETALRVFLPFGLLLRAFPFSRKTGSTVVAVIFAAYFIFPITVLINYQIWDMVTNPKPDSTNPNCATNGMGCATDAACCSLNCRYSSAAHANVCASPISDMSEYRSIFAVCMGKDSAQVNDYLQQEATAYENRLTDTYFVPARNQYLGTPGTKSEARSASGWSELWRKWDLIGGAGGGLLLPTPQKAIAGAFKSLDSLVMDAMQFTVLVMLFMVIEIIITMTLLKDFALLIGGEPRVFGMSKLV